MIFWMCVKTSAKCFIADLFAVDANAFIDSLQMRRSIEPGAKARVAENRFEKRRRRTLAVGSGDMRAGISAAGMAEPLGENADIFQIEFCGRGLRGRSQFPAERQQIPDSGVVIHFPGIS